MSLRLLDRINHGWGDLEPVIVGLMAMHKSFMLIGRHGTGKTRLARVLSQAWGPHGFAFYDATKDDLISIAGIPDPEAMRSGRLHFVPHDRSIWDKSTIVVDEITRAGKESQNLWLEILEERTCFGLPLAYRTIVATANPESYAAAFQLDEALLDRFHAVIPTPEMQENMGAEEIRTMIQLAGRSTGSLEAAELARVFADIQKAHAELLAEGALDRIGNYLGKVIPSLLGILREQNGPYVSPRTYCRNLPETMTAVAAYYRVSGVAEPLRRAAVDSLRYALATKLQIKPVILDQIHQSAVELLGAGEIPPSEQIRLAVASPATFEQRLEYVQANWASIVSALATDEIEKVLGELLRGASKKGEQEKLVALKHLLDEVGYKGDALRQVDGRLLIALNGAINHVTPRLSKILEGQSGADRERAEATIDAFRAMVAAGTFVGGTSAEVRRLQTYLIDLREGDVPSDDQSLFTFFASLDLSGGATLTSVAKSE
ncbi:MAG: MoxR family ATPase [Polyangiaceae bacterium]